MKKLFINVSRTISGEELCWLRPMHGRKLLLQPACGGEQAWRAFPGKRCTRNPLRVKLACETCRELLAKRLAETNTREDKELFDETP